MLSSRNVASIYNFTTVYMMSFSGFPGGPVVKNLPWNARYTGLVPGPGRTHMQQNS